MIPKKNLQQNTYDSSSVVRLSSNKKLNCVNKILLKCANANGIFISSSSIDDVLFEDYFVNIRKQRGYYVTMTIERLYFFFGFFIASDLILVSHISIWQMCAINGKLTYYSPHNSFIYRIECIANNIIYKYKQSMNAYKNNKYQFKIVKQTTHSPAKHTTTTVHIHPKYCSN